MKIKRAILGVFLSLVFCIGLLPAPAFAAGITVTVTGGSQIAFDEATTAYSVTVPVWYETGVDSYACEMPVITVKEGTESVAVNLPEALPGHATFAIGENTYTILLSPAKNMYAEGGFESYAVNAYSNFRLNGKQSGMQVKDDTAHTGEKSAYRLANFASSWYAYFPKNTETFITLEKGKTYLSSYATRVAPGANAFNMASTVTSKSNKMDGATQEVTASFYVDGVKCGDTVTKQGEIRHLLGVQASADWKVVQAVVQTQEEAYELMHYGEHATWGSVETRLDDLFLGELAVGRMTVTDAQGETSSEVLLDGKDQTIALTSTILNQLGTKAGFESESVTWSCTEGLRVDETGVVTIPANAAAGAYTVTAAADIAANNIGTVSNMYTVHVQRKHVPIVLEIEGRDSHSFDATMVGNQVNVPVFYEAGVDHYELPAITVKHEGAAVPITMPERLPGDATFTIDGAVYSITLKPLGANRYTNGGHEEKMPGNFSNFILDTKANGMSIVDDAAYTGTYSAKRPGGNNAYLWIKYIPEQPVLEANKTYLSSYATRLAPGAGGTHNFYDAVTSATAGQSATVTFYKNNVKVGDAQSGTESKTVYSKMDQMTENWELRQAIITPSTEYALMHYSVENWSHNGLETRLDDFFLSELSVGRVLITDAEGDTSFATVSGAEKTLALTASVLNQLSTVAGFEEEAIVWQCAEGLTVDQNGNVTIPAAAAPGVYTVTATAEVATNDIGTVSGTFKVKVLEEAIQLNSLTVEGGGKYSFNPDKTEYEVGVPVRYNTQEGVDSYTYTMPTVTATADDDCVVIEEAATVPGTTKIRVKDAEGYTHNTYTINFAPIGVNMYTNGGFENEGIPFNSNGWGSAEKITDNPAAGTFALEHKASGAGGYMTAEPQPVLSGGKTYLSSRMVRKTANTKAEPQSKEIIKVYMDGLSSGITELSYNGATATLTNAGSWQLTPADDWQALDLIISPGIDWSMKQSFMLNTGSRDYANYLALDNCYVGELIIGGAQVLANGDALPGSILTTADMELALSGKALNQLGTTAGLEGKVSKIEFQKTDVWPGGASLENNTLKIEKNTSGKLMLKAVVTVDSAAWVNAPQESFVDYITINCHPKDMQEIYVATNGSEQATGNMDDPLDSLTAARDKLRAIRAAGGNQGITVYIRGGEYEMKEQLLLTEEDSGTADAPVIWRNYEDEAVTLLGGVSVEGSDFTKVTEESVLNRIVDSSARNSVYRLDLKELGITDPGEPYYSGAYSYGSSLSDWITEPKASGIEIFYNGQAMTSARYPNEGTMSVASVVTPGWNTDEPDACEKGAPFTISVADDRLAHWTEAENALLYGFWRWAWADQTIPIGSVDVQNKQITSKWHSVFGVTSGSPFYVYNLLEEMDTEGEYYIDRANGLLYIIPPADIVSAEVKLSLLEDDLIYLNGANYVSFQGISVQATRNSPFRIEGGTGCSVKHCEIFNTADYGVKLSGTNNTVSDCHIYDVNGGVSVSGGDEVTLTPANNQVIRCHIEAFARLDKTYKPAVNLGGIGNLAAFNEIHNAPHQAIGFGGNNNKMYYNDIYDVLQSTRDAGAIYGGLSWTSRGHEIKYNYIHDIESDQVPVVEDNLIVIWGVFLDGAQCDVVVEGNVFENIKGDAVFVSGGRDNVVQNNYSINCVKMLRIIQSVLEEDLATSPHYSRIPSHVWKDGVWKNEAWKKAYPELYDMLMNLSDAEKVKPENNVVRNNLCYNTEFCTRNPVWLQEGYETENYVTTEDPGFVSLGDAPDYRLKKDAAVLKVLPTLERLPFTCMGLRGSVACLTSDGFCWEETDDGAIFRLCCEGEQDDEASVICAVYEKTGDKLRLASMTKEPVSVHAGERLHSQKTVSVRENTVVKCFLWEKNTLRPLCDSITAE